MAWSMHASRRPFSRKALIDCGHPVCMQCGYILYGVENDRCSECGTLRLRPAMHDRPLNPAELRNPEVVQLMSLLGYTVCNHCGAMWFQAEQPRERCPTCDRSIARDEFGM
jgi:rubrerythrin